MSAALAFGFGVLVGAVLTAAALAIALWRPLSPAVKTVLERAALDAHLARAAKAVPTRES